MPVYAKWVVAVLATASVVYGIWILRQIDEQTRTRLTITDIQGVVDDATEKVSLKITNKWSNEMTLTQSWQSDGNTITVSTTQREGETYGDFRNRHNSAVADEMEDHPKD